ncbi:MAG: alanine:cation symporter family protein [Pirellulaceae bacterium]|nr:alanine:cation symporter family protein [Pirellulaceae bacterium]
MCEAFRRSTFVVVLVVGVQRAVFFNEASIGSAALAHAAAKTVEPVGDVIVVLNCLLLGFPRTVLWRVS